MKLDPKIVEAVSNALCDYGQWDPYYGIEMAQAALTAAYPLVMEEAARVADSFTCGECGMDGKAGAAIRALKPAPEAQGATPARDEGRG
jgi:hypothetical protein